MNTVYHTEHLSPLPSATLHFNISIKRCKGKRLKIVIVLAFEGKAVYDAKSHYHFFQPCNDKFLTHSSQVEFPPLESRELTTLTQHLFYL